MKIIDDGMVKIVKSENYNMLFRRFKKVGTTLIPDGELLRWGKTLKDDPDYGPGPEIADIEISAGRCTNGGNGKGCRFCYKNSSPDKPLVNMSFETYQKVLDKILEGGCLTQVALGLTSVGDNPDLLRIMEYTRERGCWPNFTVSGGDKTLDYDVAIDLAERCGALAVSVTPWNYEDALDKIFLFTSLGVEQTNIHVVVAEETMPFVHKVMEARTLDPRLGGMGAIVGLMIKPKGRAKGKFHPPTQEKYEELVHRALEYEVPFGFDSCSAPRFVKAIENTDMTQHQKDGMKMNSDPCESMCFSIYVSVDGLVYPCSFCEGEEGYDSINILEAENFMEDVWMSKQAKKFREKLLTNGRCCPAFPEINAGLEEFSY